jgi:hypothetical protein
MENITNAVRVVTTPMKCSDQKKTATLKGRLDGRERARKTLDLASGKSLVLFLARKFISPPRFGRPPLIYKF